MTCGVATTMPALPRPSARRSGVTVPVRTTGGGAKRVPVTLRPCWTTRGRVGAIRSTDRSGYRRRYSAITRSATAVLPRPVGRTTSVLCAKAVVAMCSW